MNNRLGGLPIIQWLDRKRWGSDDSSWYFAKGLNSDEIILTHWLTYVTDRQMPASDVWHKGAPIFAGWVKEYSRRRAFHTKQYFSKRDGFQWRKKSFKSRYPAADLYSIQRTLKVLRSYDKSLVCYVGKVLEAYSDKEDVVSRIASALFLLTYDMNYSSRQVTPILRSRFEGYYQRWQRDRTYHKKRLWAAFRDYIKYDSYQNCFMQAFRKHGYSEQIIRRYRKFQKELRFLNQLELPGDVWNNNELFVTNFLRPLGRQLGVKVSKKDAEEGTVSEKVREICNEAQNRGYNIYPEQFDVTFDFVPKMCANAYNDTGILCRAICPLGTGDRFFLMNHPQSKYCLTYALLTGRLSACEVSEHSVFRNGTGRKTCDGFKT